MAARNKAGRSPPIIQEPNVPQTNPKAEPQWENVGSLCPWAEPAWNTLSSPYYNESHVRLRNCVRKYIDENILPYALEWERAGEAPREEAVKYVKSGLAFVGLVPSKYRPREREIPDPAGIPADKLDVFHDLIMCDEVSRVEGGVMVSLVGGANAIGAPPIVEHGTEEQKRTWLPGLFTLETGFCLGITEPGTGSDVSRIQTTATKSTDGKFYVVNGYKKWITGIPYATHMTTAVRTGGPGMSGISMLVIPINTKGFSYRRIENSGQKAGGASFIELDDVHVPVENILGRENEGFKIIMSNFNHERFIMAVGCNRKARTCMTHAMEYAHKRETFGKQLISHQIIRHKFSTLARYIESHWAWLEQLAYHVQQSRLKWKDTEIAGKIAMAKVHGGHILEMANREAQQVFGGAGYQKSGPGATVEQISRDLRMFVVGGGSSEILDDLVFRQETMLASGRGWKL